MSNQTSNQPSQALRGTQPEDNRRTIVALVSAAIISTAVLALLVIFDVK
jgi:hypothetical protein